MATKSLTHADADLVLKLYDLRREAVMRESRSTVIAKFWPKSAAEVLEVMNTMEHPLGQPLRQVSTYWEMVYGFAKHGIIDADFLVESNGEGIFLYGKLAPYIKEIREATSPVAYQNVQWITEHSNEGRRRYEIVKARLQKMMAGK